MLIKNITVENFQSYYGSQTLEFSNGLNLVIGKGGKGKSKLFNAFYWVLFGKIYITDVGWCATDSLPNSAKMSMQKHEFINQKALFDCMVNDSITTSVSLELEDDKGKLYSIIHSVQTKRLNDNDIHLTSTWEVSTNSLKISYDTNTGTKVDVGDMASFIINNLFPEGIRNYIWFQGESLESLINFRDKETLKNAVKHISY
ncbi:MAG: AAA family ATPase, partial [Alphaproteobacteria bacterium]|nr:AAA family ATPase [Alphaproteobacteria bacterium]